eukprot:TRINITY_DN15672_c0_g1_i1.p1 TRINITY_DN15672_c0_g1~~TRINITY_DN15672_c0_g1_i1.p1  ORF type:complete len:765 (+),score=123.91 TRINITY_DN15672_c0_g1_i1:74-2296(+)
MCIRDRNRVETVVDTSYLSQMDASSQNDSDLYCWRNLAESRRNCLFCHHPHLRNKSYRALIENALYSKHCYSQNYYYTKDIGDILAGNSTPAVVAYKEAIILSSVFEDSLRRLYRNSEMKEKLRSLAKYYKFHRDLPRLFALPTATIMTKYNNLRRTAEFKIVSEVIREELTREGRQDQLRTMQLHEKEVFIIVEQPSCVDIGTRMLAALASRRRSSISLYDSFLEHLSSFSDEVEDEESSGEPQQSRHQRLTTKETEVRLKGNRSSSMHFELPSARPPLTVVDEDRPEVAQLLSDSFRTPKMPMELEEEDQPLLSNRGEEMMRKLLRPQEHGNQVQLTRRSRHRDEVSPIRRERPDSSSRQASLARLREGLERRLEINERTVRSKGTPNIVAMINAYGESLKRSNSSLSQNRNRVQITRVKSFPVAPKPAKSFSPTRVQHVSQPLDTVALNTDALIAKLMQRYEAKPPVSGKNTTSRVAQRAETPIATSLSPAGRSFRPLGKALASALLRPKQNSLMSAAQLTRRLPESDIRNRTPDSIQTVQRRFPSHDPPALNSRMQTSSSRPLAATIGERLSRAGRVTTRGDRPTSKKTSPSPSNYTGSMSQPKANLKTEEVFDNRTLSTIQAYSNGVRIATAPQRKRSPNGMGFNLGKSSKMAGLSINTNTNSNIMLSQASTAQNTITNSAATLLKRSAGVPSTANIPMRTISPGNSKFLTVTPKPGGGIDLRVETKKGVKVHRK